MIQTLKNQFPLIVLFCLFFIVPEQAPCRDVLPFKAEERTVDQPTMQRIYEEVKTPYKYGIVIRENGKKVDCPSIFRFGDAWYMTYIVFDGSGYETCLAQSSDLLQWKKMGKILSFANTGWDSQQKAGYIALQDFTWGGGYSIGQYDRKYWLSYIGGALKGYETDPLSIGLAWSNTPDQAVEWNRLPEPVLSPRQLDVRYWEKLTLYKSNIIHEKEKSLGYPFVMYYNAKSKNGYERIGMAVSNDMRQWIRYGNDPVIDNGNGISGDPQIAKIGDVWVMFYFGTFDKPCAFDTFACSYDLVHWTKWKGPDLIAPSEPWDKTYAHKPWVIKHYGTVYHFYCAVGDQGRVIALAASKDLSSK